MSIYWWLFGVVPLWFERLGASRFACKCAVHVLTGAAKRGGGGFTYQHYHRYGPGHGWEVAAGPAGKIKVSL
jgi:hypothetical protein